MNIGGESNIPEEEKMATVDTENLALRLQELGSQIEKVSLFHMLRQADAEKKTGNQLFHKTNDRNDAEAAAKLKDFEAQAIEFCKRIEDSKGNEVKSTNS